MRCIWSIAGVLVLCYAPVLAGAEPTSQALNEQIERFLDSPARLAWIRDGKLMLLDTTDDRGERHVSLSLRPSRPIITPSGKQVVFICYKDWNSYVVDWSNGGLRRLVEGGRVTHVRRDDDGNEWIYWQSRRNEQRVRRLDDTGSGTVVWRFDWPARDGKSNNFQTSADGHRAACTTPWPHIGIAALPQEDARQFQVVGKGCWPQIARDNSYRVFHCHGGRHTRLAMIDGTGSKAWFVPCVPNPKRSGAETPRWSNHPRFLAATDQGWHHLPPDIYIGRFSEDFRSIEKWMRVTWNGSNHTPDLWLANAPAPQPADVAAEPAARRIDEWPPDHRQLAFLWRDVGSSNAIQSNGTNHRCQARLRDLARPSRYGSVDVTGGRLEAEVLDPNAHQAFNTARQFTLSLVLTPEAREQDGVIAWFGPAGKPNLVLQQQADTLALKPAGQQQALRLTAVGTEPGARRSLQPRPRQMVTITWRDGVVRSYIDGKAQGAATQTAPWTEWQPGRLLFGAGPDSSANWSGRIEGIAFYSRALDDTECAALYGSYATRLTTTGYAKTDRFRHARLVGISRPPSREQLREYPRALLFHAYDVRTRKGTERVHVAHWYYLDGKRLPMRRKVGETYTLFVDKWRDHPHLENELYRHDFEDPDAPWYVDTSAPTP